LTIGEFLLADHPEAWVYRHGPGSDQPITDRAISEAMGCPFGIPAQGGPGTVRQVSIECLDLPSRVIEPLATMGVRTIEDLMVVQRAALLGRPRVGIVSIERIREELLDLLFPPVVSPEKLQDFESAIGDFVTRAVDDPRRAALALGRLAPGTDRPEPLTAFGVKLDLSRERIRQLVQDTFERLCKESKLSLLNPFWRAMWGILKSSDAPVRLDQLAGAMQRRLNWSVAPGDAALERICRLHPELIVNTQGVHINAQA
jgi:hypothetical protein